MKTSNADCEKTLNTWQRRALIILGALLGGVAVNYVIRLIDERRRKGVAANTAVPPLSGPGQNVG